MELADRRLALVPEDFYVMHTKGFGLYKQGKLQKPESLTTSGRFEVQNYKPLNDRHIQPAGDGQ